ncbi:unnamed protein product [Candida verbasci]|uniref:PH domain-containing protein n=1 Tax=Candida verbasci TaxID=1227364 RepID=A0A9W4TX54_9ASCO|nr:unnamed protein product [Candida verbasci]
MTSSNSIRQQQQINSNLITPPNSSNTSPTTLLTHRMDKTIFENQILIGSILSKRSSTTKSWKKKWVVLRKCQLSYYKDSREHQPLKVYNKTNLLSYSKIENKKFHNYHFAIYTHKKTLHFKTSDLKTYENWLQQLRVFFNNEENQGQIISDASSISSTEHLPTEHLPIHSINNSNLMKLESCTSDDDFSSGNTTFQTPTNGNKFVKLDIPKEIDEERYYENGENNREFLIEKGYVEVSSKKYNQNWKRLYLLLSNLNLYFFKSENSNEVYKMFDIDNINDVIEIDQLSKNRQWCLLIITSQKRIRLSLKDEEELTKWLSGLKVAIMNNRKRKSVQ